MLPVLVIIIGILSTSAFASLALAANPIPHCTSPSHPPNLANIDKSLSAVNFLAVRFGHQRISFKREDVPCYVTPEGLAHNPKPEDHGAIGINMIGPDVTMEFAQWDDICDWVRLLIRRCCPTPNWSTSAGWIVIGDTRSLNISLVDPHHPLGSNSSAWLPTTLKV